MKPGPAEPGLLVKDEARATRLAAGRPARVAETGFTAAVPDHKRGYADCLARVRRARTEVQVWVEKMRG